MPSHDKTESSEKGQATNRALDGAVWGAESFKDEMVTASLLCGANGGK